MNTVAESILSDQSLKAGSSFYLRDDVVKVAKDLLGKILVTNFDALTAVRITETEAYKDITDKASHAFGGRKTKRNEIMYASGGTAYIYLCYGVHSLFNVVTNKAGIPDAVLIRAGEPVFGLESMLKRTGKSKPSFSLTAGPGNLSKALGIHYKDSGLDLLGNAIYVVDDGETVHPKNIISTPRVGVDYAGEDAFRPYRFYIKNSSFISKK